MNTPKRALDDEQPSAERPMILGLLIDVSASMRTLIVGPGANGGQQRIESVRSSMDTLVDKAVGYCTTGTGAVIASRIKLFAFGFGFGNPLSRWTGWNGAEVQDLLARPGVDEPLLGIDRLARDWPEHQLHISSLGWHMFGATPLLAAFEAARDRLHTAHAAEPAADRPVLFVFTDGEPTGSGTPEQITAVARELVGEGVLVMCCLLTAEPLGTERRLYAAEQPQWPAAARLMFACASALDNASPYADYLQEHHWQADPGGRLFAAVSNSEDLSTFLNLTLSRLRPPAAASPTASPVPATPPAAPAADNSVGGGTFSGPVIQTGYVGSVSIYMTPSQELGQSTPPTGE
ncbi:vWA domain-containing protein [Actinacidiphila epipremni]|uniref:VWA domain-containing protein n=1 Tax=Actinacidiphila epipremni TaxID=2053013 RepID=A0ABX0ZNA4_9ACTN|nr:vWA domain-containing protein [Actinacidiphila epipremni]NJP45393.1 VWA domain-containing protein [Actinacidiphila epipremni]